MRPCEAYLLYKQATLTDDARDHARAAVAYVDAHKGEMARNSLNNIAYGLMSNARGLNAGSLFGGSVGGVIDGILIRPVTDAATHIVREGARKFYGLHD